MHEVDCFSRQRSEISRMKTTLKDIKASAHSFILAKCLDTIDLVLQHANEVGLTTSDFRWVFPGILSLEKIARNLPKNVIAIDLPGSGDRFQPMGDENALFLGDVLNVLEIALRNNSEKLLQGNKWNTERFSSFLKR